MNQRPKSAPLGSVRIIAGSLRGSKLPVPDRPGLRPTADRVRETLFNWLQHELPGARVLDLFAGTGALGFEAASRGAADVLMVERDPDLARSLREQATRLKAGQVRVLAEDGLATFTLKSITPNNSNIDTAVSYLLSTNNGATTFSFLLSTVGASFSQFMTAGIWTMVSTSLDGTAPMPNQATTSVSAVPLPGAALLFGSALMGFFGFSNRRKV